MTIAIKIGDHQTPRRVVVDHNRGLKGSVPVPQQYGDCFENRVNNDQVRISIFVKVAGSNHTDCCPTHLKSSWRTKCSVTIPKQYHDLTGLDTGSSDCDIRNPISIEIYKSE